MRKRGVEALLAAPSFQDKEKAVESAPENEVPFRTVPETTDDHDNRQIEVGSAFAFAISAERDVEVVAQDGGERDVPAAPKFGDALGAVRRIKISWEFETEHSAKTDCHVGIAAEVEVDLKSVGQGTDPGINGVRVGRIENGVGHLPTRVGEEDFFREAENEDCDARGKTGDGVFAFAELFGERFVADDGTGDEVRKEGDER